MGASTVKTYWQSINTKLTGTTTLIPPTAGKRCIVHKIEYVVTEVTAISAPANITIGSDSPNYSNVFGNAASGFAPTTNAAHVNQVKDVPLVYTDDYVAYADIAANGLRANVGTAATGTSQTVLVGVTVTLI